MASAHSCAGATDPYSVARAARDPQPQALQPFTGVQFYAIIKAPSGASLAVGDMDTDVAFGRCVLMAGSKECGDRPQKSIAPSTAWTLHQVPFADLMQTHSGNPTTTGPDFPKNAITVLEWAIGTPSTGTLGQWELWIDDVKFY